MKRIAKDELFKNLSGFLKNKGIELTDGPYAQGVRQSCSLLAKAINLGQESLEKAKTELDKTCEHVRKVVHEKTAPKPPPVASPPPTTKARAAKPKPKQAQATPRQAKPRRK